MLEVIEKLLILQERDRKLHQLKTELANIEPERRMLNQKAGASEATLETARQTANQIESDRKNLELEVDNRKQRIEKYSLQQFQTKKNEEYRALANEIETCKKEINRIEDQQLELMERAEIAQRGISVAQVEAKDLRRIAEQQISDLNAREARLNSELEELAATRDQLAQPVDESTLSLYERLSRYKGQTAVVGIEHGVCGGCHMKLPVQAVVSCQGQKDIVNCPNCGRILYYTRDMNVAASD